MEGNEYQEFGGAAPEPIIVLEVAPGQQAEWWPPPPRRRRVRLPVLLFVATCLSTIMAPLFPAVLFPAAWPLITAEAWLNALQYSAAVMTILVCHEMGHFVQAWRYGVYASFPYFIPFPISRIGTLGAVIAMEPRKGDRRALFDIGISGPIAGLVPTMIFLLLGLHWSEVKLIPEGAEQYGDPLLVQWLVSWIFGPIPAGHDVVLHPVAFAAWVGLLLTSLNLIPVGQLDGGHVLYGLLRGRAHAVAVFVLMLAVAAVIMFHMWWWSLMLVLLLWLGPRHPPTARDDVPLGLPRYLLGLLMFAFIPLGFTPTPFVLKPDGPQVPAPRQPLPRDDGNTIWVHSVPSPSGRGQGEGETTQQFALTLTLSGHHAKRGRARGPLPLVPQRLDGGGDAAAEMHEGLAGPAVADLHDRGGPEQAAEIHALAGFRPGHGDQPHGGRLVVDHADGHFVGDDRGDGLRRGVAGDGDHVQPDRADAGHRLEFFQDEVSAADGVG
jgi:Zn-dependent protease